MNNNTLHIDLRANTLHIPQVREHAEKSLKEALFAAVPQIINLQSELPTFMVKEYGTYSDLMTEARTCYEFGFFYAAVSLLCVAAEKYAMELCSKKKGSQEKRLVLLEKSKIIIPKHHDNLKKISRTRDKYLHPGKIEEKDAKKDALEAISLFTEIIQERFNERYKIREGIIYERRTNEAIKIIVP